MAILTGYTGLFSMGHAGFMALGGYLATVLVKEYHFPLLLGLMLGGLFAGLCSFIIGFPAFRSKLRGDYFAIATLGFAEAVRLILNNVKQIGNVALGGAYGYMEIPLLDDIAPMPGYIFVLLIALVCLYLAQMFVNSQRGKNCIAVGQGRGGGPDDGPSTSCAPSSPPCSSALSSAGLRAACWVSSWAT